MENRKLSLGRVVLGAMALAAFGLAGCDESGTSASAAHDCTACEPPEVEDYHQVGEPGEPAFQNGAANYGSGYSTLAFFKTPEEIVHVKGVVTGLTNVETIFTFPTGYRPSERRIFAQWNGNTIEVARIDVLANGDLIAVSGATEAYLSLELAFRAEQ